MQASPNRTIVAGLPGRNIKPSQAALEQASKPSRSPGRGRSPLGISINTNVQPSHKPPPTQVFYPTGEDQSIQPVGPSIRKQKPSLKLGKQISPYDADIPICCSPTTLSGTPGALKGSKLRQQTVRIPDIIVTPIEEDFGQSSPLPRRDDISRYKAGLSPNVSHVPRIASSIYSPINTSRYYSHDGIASRSRSASDATIIEDDEGDVFCRTQATRKSSLDSVLPTPQRSVGWWNLIASPLPRRSSSSSSGQSKRKKDIDEEHSPLVANAADMDRRGERDLTRLDDPATRRQVEESHFYYYQPDMTGEAAKYYDPSYDVKQPPLQPQAETSSPTRSIEDLSPAATHDERWTPAVMPSEDSFRSVPRTVPPPTLPCKTPPKSSTAAVLDRFQTPVVGSNGPKLASSTPSPQPAPSPFSPSPVMGTARVEYFQSVKTPRRSSSSSRAPPAESTPAPGPELDTPKRHNPPAIWDATDTGSTPPQPPPPRRYDSASTVGYLAPPSSHPSTLPNSPHSSRGRLASPFETPSQAQQSRGANHAPKNLDYDEKYYAQAHDAEMAKRKRSRRCLSLLRKRWFIIMVGILFFVIVALAVALAMFLTVRPAATPVEVGWLNLTGFPPMPTGISTVAQPSIVQSVSGCVQSTDMWSCALPKEEQTKSPNNGPAPSFRLEILFSQDGLSGALPRPPSIQEQSFLGNTTDNVTAPYDGDSTPFYISFLPTTVPGNINHISKRSIPSNSSTLNNIPSPTLLTNGSTAPAQLYPFPVEQPLRLLNRGQDAEHYSFYTYFARSIFLASSYLNGTTSDDTSGDLNINGGAPLASANTVCTFAQTRFHVQIWTQKATSLIGTSSSNDFATSNTSYIPPPASSTNNTSAFDFNTPGSFPYPITISLDRHGGAAKYKGVYCYGLDPKDVVVSQQKALIDEDRVFEGIPVNPAKAPFTAMTGSAGQGGDAFGGIDGGTGGCRCRWQNFAE